MKTPISKKWVLGQTLLNSFHRPPGAIWWRFRNFFALPFTWCFDHEKVCYLCVYPPPTPYTHVNSPHLSTPLGWFLPPSNARWYDKTQQDSFLLHLFTIQLSSLEQKLVSCFALWLFHSETIQSSPHPCFLPPSNARWYDKAQQDQFLLYLLTAVLARTIKLLSCNTFYRSIHICDDTRQIK